MISSLVLGLVGKQLFAPDVNNLLIAWIPPTTMVDSVSAIGPKAQLIKPGGKVTWTLTSAPSGMSISKDGQLAWSSPRFGRYLINVNAKVGSTQDTAQWWVQVVRPEYSGAVVVSSRFSDFVVPSYYAKWFVNSDSKTLVDAWYSWIRGVVGQDLCDGRQCVVYVPSMGGGGLSGNPVTSGPFWWGNDTIDAWRLGCFYHEIGHNFHGQTSIFDYIPGGGVLIDKYLHHLMEVSQTVFWANVERSPASYTRTGVETLRAFVKRQNESYETRFQEYQRWLTQGGNATTFSGDHYGAWAGIVRRYGAKYGFSALTTVLKAFRKDGISSNLAVNPVNDNQRFALLFSVMSNAAGTDLRSTFRSYGFPIDENYYSYVDPIIRKTVAGIPADDLNGWKFNPFNGHYYRLTPWPMSWDQAERTARLVGGHLATVRSIQEQNWLSKSFKGRYPLWIGLNDIALEGRWEWTSGENVASRFWAKGEPNGGRVENCAALYPSIGGGAAGLWIDGEQRSSFIGIMEVNSRPTGQDPLFPDR